MDSIEFVIKYGFLMIYIFEFQLNFQGGTLHCNQQDSIIGYFGLKTTFFMVISFMYFKLKYNEM